MFQRAPALHVTPLRTGNFSANTNPAINASSPLLPWARVWSEQRLRSGVRGRQGDRPHRKQGRAADHEPVRRTARRHHAGLTAVCGGDEGCRGSRVMCRRGS